MKKSKTIYMGTRVAAQAEFLSKELGVSVSSLFQRAFIELVESNVELRDRLRKMKPNVDPRQLELGEM